MGSMRKSRLSGYKQGRLIEHFVSGTTARTAVTIVGVNKSTSAYFYHRLREMIAYELDQESDSVFDGEIEEDESYFGGRRKRGVAGKIPVFGLLKRGGKGYTKIIADASSTTLIPIIERKVMTVSFILTAGEVIMCWMSSISSTIVSTTPSSLQRREITSTALRTFRTKRSVICENSTVCRRRILDYF